VSSRLLPLLARAARSSRSVVVIVMLVPGHAGLLRLYLLVYPRRVSVRLLYIPP
jgi:hypothetical protein